MLEKQILVHNGDGSFMIFDRNKIEKGLEKFIKSTNNEKYNEDFIDNITDEICKKVSQNKSSELSISDIDNITIDVLFGLGEKDLFRQFVIFRDLKDKEKIKQDELNQKKIENNTLKVTKRNGKKELLQEDKIKKVFYSITKDIDKKEYSYNDFYEQLKKFLVDGIKTKDLGSMMIKSCIDQITPEKGLWKLIAGRLILLDIYKEASLNRGISLKKIYSGKNYQSLFLSYIKKGNYYKKFMDFYSEDDLITAGNYINKSRDFEYDYNTMLMLKKRYLLNPNKKIAELPQEMYMSIALFLAIPEKLENRLSIALKFYDACSSQEISLPTPTLLNARTNFSQLSSCFKISLDDDLRGIYHGIENMAQISKFGGGIGTYLGNIRSKGGSIRGVNGASGGVAPFIKVINDTAIAVNQLGARAGAISVTLDIWHRDIYDFLDLQTETGDIRRKSFDIFPAVSIPDLFMERVENNQDWSLFDPQEVLKKKGWSIQDFFGDEFKEKYVELENTPGLKLVEKVNAKELFKKLLKSVVETGMPYVFFRDTVNKLNPNKHKGNIYSTQLCVTGDTRIHCEKGLVKVEDLYKDFKEEPLRVSYDKRTDFDINKQGVGIADTIGIYKTGEQQDIFKIETKEGYSIKSTGYHKYYRVVNGVVEKIDLRDLKVGDKLMVQSGEGIFGNEGNYKEGLLLGLVTGDGFIDNEGMYIGLYNELIPLEKDIVKYINEIILENKDSGLFKISDTSRNLTDNNKVIQHTENSKKIIISSKRLLKVFNHKYGIKKDNKLTIPEKIYQGNKDFIKGYLKGLFLTDGSVVGIPSPKSKIPIPSIQITSISLALLEGVQILLSNFGIQCSIYKSKRLDSKRFTYTDKKGIFKEYESKENYRLDINGMNAVIFMKKIGLFGKKEEKYNSIIKERKEKGFSDEIIGKKQFKITINKISFVGKGDVYDTTQLYNHSLIFNGIVTGNCVEINQNTSPAKFKEEVIDEEGNVAIKYTPGDLVVCNLASINVSKVFEKEHIERTIPLVIRILDNVIDLNFYPVKEAEITAMKYRSVGLGFLGLAELLAKEKHLAYDSSEAREYVDRLFEKFAYETLKASNQLAEERGKYPLFDGSEWSKGVLLGKDKEWFKNNSKTSENWSELIDNIQEKGTRFAYHLAPAPNTSTALVVGTTASILPIYKKYYVETNSIAPTVNVAPGLNQENFWYYKEYVNMNMNDVIDMVGTVYKWIDQSISFEWIINPQKVSPKELYEYYFKSWRQGIKTVYYVRSMSLEVQECVSCSG